MPLDTSFVTPYQDRVANVTLYLGGLEKLNFLVCFLFLILSQFTLTFVQASRFKAFDIDHFTRGAGVFNHGR